MGKLLKKLLEYNKYKIPFFPYLLVFSLLKTYLEYGNISIVQNEIYLFSPWSPRIGITQAQIFLCISGKQTQKNVM